MPTECVDYLNSNWNDLDCFETWKHVVKDKETSNQQSRLENAAWRSFFQLTNGSKKLNPKVNLKFLL
jgi:hypothetical protein